jgi:hypothetical protein
MCKTKNCFIILVNELLAHQDVFNKKKTKRAVTCVHGMNHAVTSSIY